MKKQRKEFEKLDKARKEAIEFYKKKMLIEVLDYNQQNGMERFYLAFKRKAN